MVRNEFIDFVVSCRAILKNECLHYLWLVVVLSMFVPTVFLVDACCYLICLGRVINRFFGYIKGHGRIKRGCRCDRVVTMFGSDGLPCRAIKNVGKMVEDNHPIWKIFVTIHKR